MYSEPTMRSGRKGTAILLGNTGIVARQLIPQLVTAGYRGYIVSRNQPDLPEGFSWVKTLDLQDGTFTAPAESIVIGLWPVWIVADIAQSLTGVGQLIALSSTSVFSKKDSDDPAERDIAQLIMAGESKISDDSEKTGVPYTILRPTIVYDCETDQSINKIANVMRRFGFLAIAGSGRGLRQPIHAGDVAEAIVRCIGRDDAYNSSLNITGSDTISYRTMVERIAIGLGRRPRIVPVPTFVLESLVSILRASRLTRHGPSFVHRMNKDLVFDGNEAIRRLGFTPRGFSPRFQDATRCFAIVSPWSSPRLRRQKANRSVNV